MLNEMFGEIQSILGDGYGLFQEFAPKSILSNEYWDKYKNLGVLYVNDGTPNFIPDGASMTIDYTLSLLMRIENGVNTSDLIVEPLEKLSSAMTGILYTEKETWKYMLNVGLPTTDGEIHVGSGFQFITYDIPITAIVASGVLLTDTTKKIKISIGTTSDYLKGVITCTEMPSAELESAIFLNSGTLLGETSNSVESLVVARGWGLHITKLYRPDDPIDKALRSEALQVTSDNIISVEYAMGNESPITRNCIISDVTFANEKGQAVIMSFTLSKKMRTTA